MSNTYTNLFEAVDTLTAWLDSNTVVTREEIGMRILKLCEESGEAVGAWIGFIGQNPRKGITHTKDDVVQELADVVVTALVAMKSLGVSPDAVISAHCRKLKARVNLS